MTQRHCAAFSGPVARGFRTFRPRPRSRLRRSPSRKQVYSKVAVNGVCTGTANDPLVQAILLHQTALKHKTMDGKISVAKGDGRAGGALFFILRLNARLAHMYPNFWPRVDLIQGCPPQVAEAVRATIPYVIEPIA